MSFMWSGCLEQHFVLQMFTLAYNGSVTLLLGYRLDDEIIIVFITWRTNLKDGAM